jgi:hypothetical protein
VRSKGCTQGPATGARNHAGFQTPFSGHWPPGMPGGAASVPGLRQALRRRLAVDSGGGGGAVLQEAALAEHDNDASQAAIWNF